MLWQLIAQQALILAFAALAVSTIAFENLGATRGADEAYARTPLAARASEP